MNFQGKWSGTNGAPQAQRDVYNGIEFRSKLESKTAQAMDILGIRYRYEHRGYKLSNGLWYCPDFWLPDAEQFVECKGEMKSTDSAKIVGLVEYKKRPVIVLSYKNAMLFMLHRNMSGNPMMTYSSDVIRIAECLSCGTKWFVSISNTLECPKCRAGRSSGCLNLISEVKSAQQLFEYSQGVAADKPIYKAIARNFNN